MNAGKVVLLDPVGYLESHTIAPRRTRSGGLEGAKLGVLTNMFRGEDLPGAIAERLKDEYGVSSIIWYEKEILSRTAADSIIDNLAENTDCVLVGLCG